MPRVKEFKAHGVPRVAPQNPRPACKRCGGQWDGGPFLLCDRCYEHDLQEYERNDARESDRGIRW